MVVGEIWRYPVKSMGGEQLDATVLIADGIPGDRIVHARDGSDVITARSHPALLGFHATLGPDAEPLVDGQPWSSEAVAARIPQAVGPDEQLAPYDGPERLAILPPLLAPARPLLKLRVGRPRVRSH